MCLNPPCEIFAMCFFMVRSGKISHHEENLLAKLVIWHDAVAFRRPYLPHFSSKSYTVWSVGFLTSWALKWYIACRKWTSVSAPKVWKKTQLLSFVFFTLFFLSPLFFPCILWTTLAKGYGAPKLGSSWIWASKSFTITCPSSSSIIWHAWIDS